VPKVTRGEVVLVDFPYSDGRQSKIRPALVIQADAHNTVLLKTVIAMITGNLRRRGHPAHVLLDPAVHQGVGVNGPSLVSCINLFTVDQSAVLRVLGQLTPALQANVDAALKSALDL
jgi:mRNA interferase MazF